MTKKQSPIEYSQAIARFEDMALNVILSALRGGYGFDGLVITEALKKCGIEAKELKTQVISYNSPQSCQNFRTTTCWPVSLYVAW